MTHDAEQIDEDTYELDLDEAEASSVDEAIEDAVAAVERHHSERRADDDDAQPDATSASTPPSPAADSAAVDDEPMRERLMRTLADFDNFRKRSEREKASLKQYAVSELMKDILDVVDNLERALGSEGGVDELKQGVEMILRQQREIMRRHGVRRVEAEGQPFDPTVHEAVMRQEQEGLSGPTVVAELQSGYMLHDRLLRPAMVNVAMPAPRRASASVEDGGED